MGLSPAKRRLALEQLGRERLNELTQRYALDVGDRRVLDHHIDALVRARSVDFAEVLGSLKREELQALCEALGLERGGREKEALVQRILGAGDGSAQPAQAAKRGQGRKLDTPRQASLELPPTQRLTVDQLERHLWSAADILRAPSTRPTTRTTFFGLLFLKRLLDVFEETASLPASAHESKGWLTLEE